MWAGVLRDYYHPRWSLFVGEIIRAVNNKVAFNQTAFEHDLGTVENIWITAHNVYPTRPRGNTIQISNELFQKYKSYYE